MRIFLPGNVKNFTIIVSAAIIAVAQTPGVNILAADYPHIVPRARMAVRVDGNLDEPLWDSALILDLSYEVFPGENVPPPVRTEVLLAYDGKHFYAAFRCYDPDPSAISAHLADRDNISGGDDYVAILVDTFHDQRRGFKLKVNPLGVQSDYVLMQYGNSSSWDAIWNSAGRITEWGYAVEIAIPFNQLRFQRTGAPQVWGFDAERSYPRGQTRTFGTFPRDRSNNCYLCQTKKIIGFDNASPGRNVEISPTLTGVRTDMRDDFPGGDLERENEEADFGVTARWGMTPNLNLGATYNPDFSQVEADAMQLEVNRPFTLYFSERRPFFLEGYDFFRTLKTALYTRMMIDPLWGAKLSGKEGRNTIGAYLVRDELTRMIFPGSTGSRSTTLERESTASALRYKRDIGNRYTLGAMITDREGRDYYSRLAGLDGDFRITDNDQIQIQVLGSQTDYPDDVAAEHGQHTEQIRDRYIAFEYDHDSRNIYWWLDYDDVGRDFRADLGFIPRVGFRNVEGGGFYTWYPAEDSWWSRFRLGHELNYYENDDGKLLEKGGNIWFSYNGALQSSLYLEGAAEREIYNDEEFDLAGFYLSSGIRPTGDLICNLWGGYGDRIDYTHTRPGKRYIINPYVRWNATRHLSIGAEHVFERMNAGPGRLYDANISQMTLIYQFNVRTFLRAIAQYVDYRYNTENYENPRSPEFRHFFSQLLFSYKINPWTVLFLGYSDNHFGERDYDLIQHDRTFFVKIGYAWTI